MESQLNRSLVNIQEFDDNHKITFNASKSTVSLFTTNRHLYNYSPELFLMNERLNYSKYPTYLGFTLDSEVNCGGCRSDTGRAGSSIFSNTPGNDVKIIIRNPDHCSVFRSELIAISGALNHALNSYKDSIWILTGSRSSIQYLKNWPKIMDSTGLDILYKLVRLGQRKQVCLQRISSHVDVPENEAADELAGRGCHLVTSYASFL
ncbi:RNase H domain-containing protein [Trichonephila clavipes]|nr:RNase H domain-containing protein [Trichonephila clavipes]